MSDSVSTRDALLAAVLANPDEDLPRLMLIDELLEFGDESDREWAEFAKWQFAHDEGCDCELSFLDARVGVEGLLSYTYRSSFDILSPCSGDVLWVKGFVEEVKASADHWQRIGDAITSRHPIRTVRLTSRPQIEVTRSDGSQVHLTLAAVEGEPQSKRVTISASPREYGRFRDGFDDEMLRRLLASNWPRVRLWEWPPIPTPTLLGSMSAAIRQARGGDAPTPRVAF